MLWKHDPICYIMATTHVISPSYIHTHHPGILQLGLRYAAAHVGDYAKPLKITSERFHMQTSTPI